MKVSQETVQILRSSLKLLEKGICRKSYARDSQGKSVRFDDEGACAWCTYGALFKVIGKPQDATELTDAVAALRHVIVSDKTRDTSAFLSEDVYTKEVRVLLTDWHDASSDEEILLKWKETIFFCEKLLSESQEQV